MHIEPIGMPKPWSHDRFFNCDWVEMVVTDRDLVLAQQTAFCRLLVLSRSPGVPRFTGKLEFSDTIMVTLFERGKYTPIACVLYVCRW